MTYSSTSLPRAPHWTDDAACARPGYLKIREFWFADDSHTDQVRTATTICGHCPAKDACLTAAVDEETGRGEQSMYGIRGGLTAKERWLKKKRESRQATRATAKGPKPPAECGTLAAYHRHSRAGEPIDEACRAAATEYRRERRGAMPRNTGCGTRSGYQAHRKRGEKACAPCRQANTDADNRLRRTGTTKPKPVVEEPRPLPAGVARCGTTDGYDAHKRWQEPACQPCQAAHDTDTEQRQAAARAAAAVPSLPTCGTRSGYDTHVARGEAPCTPCTDARASTDWLLRTGVTTAA